MTAHSAAERGTGDKRERILLAAERIFARHGFFAAKVSDVAKEAGVADGTIYLYFKSKDDLLISYFERRMQQLNDTLIAATAIVAPSDQLHTFIRTYLQLVHDEPTAAEVLTIELRQSSKFMKEYANPAFAEFLRLLGGIIATAQDKGEVDPSIPSHVAARMIFGVLDELSLAWVLAKAPSIDGATPGTRPKKFDIVRAADWVITLVTTGLQRKPEKVSP